LLGFVGKVLLEKLLRSVPNLKQIYILIRVKKGSSINERYFIAIVYIILGL
jgi:hypothetical protein